MHHRLSRRQSLRWALLLAAPALGRLPVPTRVAAASCPDDEEGAFLALINEFRANHGVAPLGLSRTLGAAAAAHSQDMASRNFPRAGSDDNPHVNPDGEGIQERTMAFGWRAARNRWSIGENIFVGDGSAAAAFDWWRDSSPHRAGMLNEEFEAIGIGRAFETDSDWGWYWTSTFASEVDMAPDCAEPEPEPEPEPDLEPEPEPEPVRPRRPDRPRRDERREPDQGGSGGGRNHRR